MVHSRPVVLIWGKCISLGRPSLPVSGLRPSLDTPPPRLAPTPTYGLIRKGHWAFTGQSGGEGVHWALQGRTGVGVSV